MSTELKTFEGMRETGSLEVVRFCGLSKRQYEESSEKTRACLAFIVRRPGRVFTRVELLDSQVQELKELLNTYF